MQQKSITDNLEFWIISNRPLPLARALIVITEERGCSDDRELFEDRRDRIYFNQRARYKLNHQDQDEKHDPSALKIIIQNNSGR